MKPSDALISRREAVLAALSRKRATRPRVFGSVASGVDCDGSDLDLLIDVRPGTTLFELGGLQEELEEILGVQVDLLTPGDLPRQYRARVLAEAKPL